MRQTTNAEVCLEEAKPRVPDPQGEQPERLAENEAGCARISLRCASMRRKIALNSPGIWGMSAKMAPQWCLVSLLCSRREDRVPTRRGKNDGGYASQRRRKHGTKRSRDFHGLR